MMLLTQLIGWAGMILLVAGYALVTTKRFEPTNARILLLNLAGSACIAVSVYTQRAWPALALQAVWAAIALAGLVKNRRRP